MDSGSLVLVCALSSACFMGAASFSLVRQWVARHHRMRALCNRASCGADSPLALASSGLSAWIIGCAWRQTRLAEAPGASVGVQGLLAFGSGSFERPLCLAGLSSSISPLGSCRARILLALVGMACGAVSGVLFTIELMLVGTAVGMVAGWRSVSFALGREGICRRKSLERHLSEAVEVICLGLRAGLSFDRALDSYCDCFECGLARELRVAHRMWDSGLRTREDALKDVAETYDSPLFVRIVDSIVRSMRFGSPLADALDVLAVEARREHRVRVEESVMKAPVKMMVPVGTLILPSMLLLVLGPVLLDLMEGF
jgi:tight adherence protein C